METIKPYIGLTFNHSRLGKVKVIAIRDFGTIDVQSVKTGNFYRISGLSL